MFLPGEVTVRIYSFCTRCSILSSEIGLTPCRKGEEGVCERAPVHRLRLAIALPLCARGAFEGITAGGPEVGLAGATVALRAGQGILHSNPACLAGITGFTLTASACPALFGIPDLRCIASTAGLAVPWGGIGASVSTLGLPGYRETTASLSCAYGEGSAWTAGIRVSLLFLTSGGMARR